MTRHVHVHFHDARAADVEQSAIRDLYAAFRQIKVDSAARQMGTRALRDCVALGGRDPEEEQRLFDRARYYLPMAKAFEERAMSRDGVIAAATSGVRRATGLIRRGTAFRQSVARDGMSYIEERRYIELMNRYEGHGKELNDREMDELRRLENKKEEERRMNRHDPFKTGTARIITGPWRR